MTDSENTASERSYWEKLLHERDEEGPTSIACSYCKAQIGSSCVTPKRRQPTSVHAQRRYEFARLLDDVWNQLPELAAMTFFVELAGAVIADPDAFLEAPGQMERVEPLEIVDATLGAVT
jgi:hypothetical protein